MSSHSCYRHWCLVLAVPAALCLAVDPADGQCTLANASRWNVVSGAWETAANWTAGGIPNGGNACLTNGTAVTPAATTMNAGESVGNLQIGSKNTLNISNNTTLTVNPGSAIANSGAIVLNSTGNNTFLSVGNGVGTTTLSGYGVITLIDTLHFGHTAITGFGGTTLENTNNTIQGEGTIGYVLSNLVFQNDSEGTVLANVNGRKLILNSSSVINAGALRAAIGGTLQISTDVNNFGGTISSDAGSAVTLNGGAVRGGTLSGNVQDVASAILDGATHGQIVNAGALTLSVGSQLTVGGTIDNTGSILVNGTGAPTSIYAGNGPLGATLTGTGTVTLTDTTHGSEALIYGDGGSVFENKTNTIQGAGQIGAGHNFILQNDAGAVVNANANGYSLILNGANVINAGALQASGGGKLEIATTINNLGGTISTDAGSTVLLDSGAAIQGGTLNGNIQTNGGNPLLDGITHGQLNSAGLIAVGNGNQLQISGTLNNSGSIALSAAGSATALYVGNTGSLATLTGMGALTLSDTAHNGNAVIYGDGGAVLENTNNTIQGEGQLGGGHNFLFQNDNSGAVNANVSGRSLLLNAHVVNFGTLEATGGGTLEIASDVAQRGGGFIRTFGANSTVLLDNGAWIQGGTIMGNFRANGNGALLDGSTQGAIFDYAAIAVNSGNRLLTTGAIYNLGSLVMNGGSLSVDGALTNYNVLQGSGRVSGAGSLTNAGRIVAQGGLLDLSGLAITNLSGGTLAGGSWWSGDTASGLIPGPLELPGNIVTNSADLRLTGAGAQILNAGGSSALAGFTTNLGAFAVSYNASFTTGGNFTNDNTAASPSAGLSVLHGGSMIVAGDLINSNNALVNVDFRDTSLTVTRRILPTIRHPELRLRAAEASA